MEISVTIGATATGQTPVSDVASITGVDAWAVTGPVTIAHGDSDVELNIAPVDSDADVKFVLIKVSAYPETVPGTPDVSYKIHADTGTPIPMGNCHLYLDNMDLACGAAGLAFDKLFFSNAHASTDVTVTVYVGYVALA